MSLLYEVRGIRYGERLARLSLSNHGCKGNSDDQKRDQGKG